MSARYADKLQLAQRIYQEVRKGFPGWHVTLRLETGEIIAKRAEDGFQMTLMTSQAWHAYRSGATITEVLDGVIGMAGDMADYGVTRTAEHWLVDRERLRIQVSSRLWIDNTNRHARKAGVDTSQARMMLRPWQHDCSLRLVLDTPHMSLGVMSQHVEGWGVDEAELWERAEFLTIDALLRARPDFDRLVRGVRYRSWTRPDTIPVSRLAFPETMGLPSPEDLVRLAVAPHRDLLMVADAYELTERNARDILGTLMSTIARQPQSNYTLLGRAVLLQEGNNWKDFNAG